MASKVGLAFRKRFGRFGGRNVAKVQSKLDAAGKRPRPASGYGSGERMGSFAAKLKDVKARRMARRKGY